jgi:tRNA (guanine-N7-)-methyltransferase
LFLRILFRPEKYNRYRFFDMPKNKRLKYDRVKHLPNVTLAEDDDRPWPVAAYPWNRRCYANRPKVLELGCGKGEYSLALAAANPDHLVVGVDYKSHRICVGAEKAIEQGIGNVYFLRARVEGIAKYFTSYSTHQIWLTFPDPHLKNRNTKKRLTAAPFLDAYAKLLTPDGIVILITDSTQLYQYSLERVLQWGGRVIADWDNRTGGIAVSAYEDAALSREAAIRTLAFELRRNVGGAP